MKAIRIIGEGATAITDEDIPELRDGSLLVRVVCVALNPLDAKNIYDAGPAETLLGTDYSGVVEKTGQGYTKEWKVGDRIFGFVMGANAGHPTDGAFAEYALVKADVQYRMPDHMSFEQAASLGVGLSTAAMGICHKLHMPIDLDEDSEDRDGAAQNVFIHGGSTATGTMSIQLARM
jgi:NADPH:quinone reductase-like Zn-dependent oxidoreductase